MIAVNGAVLMTLIGTLIGVMSSLFWMLVKSYERQIHEKDIELRKLREDFDNLMTGILKERIANMSQEELKKAKIFVEKLIWEGR